MRSPALALTIISAFSLTAYLHATSPDTVEKQTMDAAYAKLHAREAAATQKSPATAPTAKPATAPAPIDPDKYTGVVHDLLVRGEKLRPERLAQLRKWGEQISGTVTHLEARHRDKDAMTMRAYQQRLRDEIARLEKPYSYLPPIDSFDVGQAGRLIGKCQVNVIYSNGNGMVNLPHGGGCVYVVNFQMETRVVSERFELPCFQVTGTNDTHYYKKIEPVDFPPELADIAASNHDDVDEPPISDPGPPSTPGQIEHHPTIHVH